ncbi:phosphate starvation-inducible protein PsiF [Pandoraea terrae]|uniref:Phosphate starvation-inducible protein PsiF n=1 Tax=Pandoraea terrae TaxID=1537710 RepID=A0A5E4ZDC7_9BURK|nr:PsiF family protein [Pandoraea terrae]VVE58677.1 phosphate starvation-inducible protein PsiF [Pandoraea terrae]
MKKAFALVLLLSPLLASPVFAQNAQPAQNAQQSKMKTCNAQAGDKKGDERKAYMKECLSAAAPAKAPTQQEKMKMCNKDATGKTGDERKAFMKDCLSKKS